jgi:hypothetical protein
MPTTSRSLGSGKKWLSSAVRPAPGIPMLRAFAVTFTFIGGSATSCEPPLNCGEYNKSTACNHTFTGCDVCDTCCKSWLKPVDICDGCVKDECTSGRHPDCCVSFRCDALTGQCIRAFRATGAYPNMSACEKACSAPSGVCTGSSVDLVSNDCNAWRSFSLDPMYKGWIEGKCGAKVHTDPCNCTFAFPHDKQVGCAKGRITTLRMGHEDMPSGGIPLPLLDLTGLTSLYLAVSELTGSIPSAIGQLTELTILGLGGNNLTGSIPSTLGALKALVALSLNNNQLTGSMPSAIAKLTKLTQLNLGNNLLTGTVPQEMLQLEKLTFICLPNMQLTGKLPKFNFSQFTECCSMGGDTFTCPLPTGANTTCAGGPSPHCVCHSR